jgi:dihydroorotate dehydrogenase (fumarate)
MDLSTNYLGLKLSSPLMPGASPLVDDLDVVRRLEDAGASAIVMHSLFEEQLSGELEATQASLEANTNSFSEASSFLPAADEFRLRPDAYLEQLRRIKAAVKVPVIGSLNGSTVAGWLGYATLMELAGADALELNFYYVAADPEVTAEEIERRTLEAVRLVKKAVRIPVAVKLSPFFSALSNFALKAEQNGADGLVIFNRFYQPDIDLDALEVTPRLHFSDSSELLLRLRWLAVLSAQRRASLAVSGGVHTALDAVKAIAAGASAVQMVAALLKHGPQQLKLVKQELASWLEEHEYTSLKQLQGSMNLARCPNPAAFERGNYLRILQSWRPGGGPAQFGA